MTEPTIQDVLMRLDQLDNKIDPIIAAYDSILLSKQLIVGVAGFIMVVAAFGGGILWLASLLNRYFKF